MAIVIKNGEFTCIKFGDGSLEQKMRAGYQRAKKMTMEQAFEEGKRKEQFMTSDGGKMNNFQYMKTLSKD